VPWAAWPAFNHAEASGEQVSARRTAVATLVGLTAGILLSGLVWGAVAMSRQSTGESARTQVAAPAHSHSTSTAPSPSVLGTEASRPVTATPLDRCRRTATAQRALLDTATPALNQWEVHIGAMNKLVSGAITLDQANAFWNQTRVGAASNVETFLAADRRYRQRGQEASCPGPREVTAASAAVSSCADAVAARDRVIRAARSSAGTWGKHVHHMEMLRSGQLSAAKATEMWLSSWQRGVHQLDRYHDALRDSRGQHC
jgi:hypothetical protein